MSNDNVISLGTGPSHDELMKLVKITNWLSDAARAAGADVEGSGVEVASGIADVGFTLGGRRYRIEIIEVVEVEERSLSR
jgi:hypothetical protein